MSSFALVAVLTTLLLFAGGADAARLYPTSQEIQKFNSGTSFFSQAGLIQGLADKNKSGSLIPYWAEHQIKAREAAGFYGFSVTTDVYHFSLTSEQSSLALVNIFTEEDGVQTSINSIQIGWEVIPKAYNGDSHVYLYSYWSIDGRQDSPCPNPNCPVGFQPEAGAAIVLGDVIDPTSWPNGIKQSITLKVLKDGASGDWLVHCGFNQQEPALIGRYPKSLFPGGLADRATHIHIGGVVVARSTDLAPMGSGYLPSTAAAASFYNFQIIDQNGQAWLVNHNFPGYLSQPDTYSVSPIINGQFFYGGPFQSTM